jgi:molybdopterin/thiamine biosynthesis adenylyltransferase/molybdopterin synthase catalytic subunit/rhodanese-related sulfurtransferase
MQAFAFSHAPLEPDRYRRSLEDPEAGGYASFEGWVRDHNEGRTVQRLEYEAFETLALKEGERIVNEAAARFGVTRAACVHRVGALAIGELAVWVGVSAAHRGEAFAACRYIIDEVKHRVPIWKKEHYVDGESGWVNCERCAAAAHDHDHDHDHGPVDAHGRDPDELHASGDFASLHHAHGHAPVHDYSRQIALPEVGRAGQAKLAAASVLVVGAGGLGVPVLQYLAAAGVGRLGIVDGDVIEASNLHRQPLYGVADIGRPKAAAAAERLRALNSEARIEAHAIRASAENIDALVRDYDLVVECTDNFRAKFLVSDAVVRALKPAVFASVHQYEGQLQVYRPLPHWPCLRCLWPEAPRDGIVGNCAEAGVLGPVPGTLGALQAMQALKRILGLDAGETPALVTVDLLTLDTQRLAARRDPDCDHERPGEDAPLLDQTTLELEFTTLAEAFESGLELVDIREEWERSHDPPGLQIASHLPLSELVSGHAEFPSDGRYLVVCAHGVRSLSLAEHLRHRGQSGVYSLRGGLAALRA